MMIFPMDPLPMEVTAKVAKTGEKNMMATMGVTITSSSKSVAAGRSEMGAMTTGSRSQLSGHVYSYKFKQGAICS